MGGRRDRAQHERIDIGGAFGKNKEPAYLAMNPNCLVPTLEEEDGFTAVGIEFDRALSRRQARQERRARAERPEAARARQPMDGLAVVGRRAGDHAGVLGPDPHAAGKARHGGDQGVAGQDHRGDENPRRAARQDAITSPATEFSYGDIPVGIMCYRYRPAGAGAAADAESRPLVRRRFPNARRSRTTSAAFR